MQELIEAVSLSEELLFRYPRELSGGQLQRVAIARVLGMKPEFIVADEPHPCLTLLSRPRSFSFSKKLQTEYRISFLFISHDMRVVEWMSDKVALMEGGKIIGFR
nr:ABC transporter ATP-binding protein [Methanosarcina horonobensis]